jgi:peptidoglycan/LPS O-acetylase OafA/YrhL
MAVLYRPGHDPSRVYYGTDTRAQSLLIGAMLAILFAGGERTVARTHRRVLHGAAIAAALALAVIWTTTSESDGWQYRGGFALAAVLVTVVIASVTLPGDTGPLGALLSSAPLRAIGIISYGLYLWHWPIYVYLSEDRTGLGHSQLLVLRLAVTSAAAGASFVLLERPIRHGSLPIPRRAVRRARLRRHPCARCGSCSSATRWRRAWSRACSPRPTPATSSSGASRYPGAASRAMSAKSGTASRGARSTRGASRRGGSAGANSSCSSTPTSS